MARTRCRQNIPFPSALDEGFLQEYVLEHGTLLVGKHWIRVQGYSGNEHDFSGLSDG
jgi:hypothetical protein